MIDDDYSRADEIACVRTARLTSQIPEHVLFSISGFMPNGLIRISANDLELGKRDIEEGRIAPDFSMDLIFTDISDEESVGEAVKPISYVDHLDRRLSKCLVRLVKYHHVKVDEGLLKSLEKLGSTRIVGE